MNKVDMEKMKDCLIDKINRMYESDPKHFHISFNNNYPSGSFWCVVTNDKYKQKNLEQILGFD
jgi:hypothetical protein